MFIASLNHYEENYISNKWLFTALLNVFMPTVAVALDMSERCSSLKKFEVGSNEYQGKYLNIDEDQGFRRRQIDGLIPSSQIVLLHVKVY